MNRARGVMPQRLGHPVGTLLLGSPVVGLCFASAPISGTLHRLIGSFSTASVTCHAASGRPVGGQRSHVRTASGAARPRPSYRVCSRLPGLIMNRSCGDATYEVGRGGTKQRISTVSCA